MYRSGAGSRAARGRSPPAARGRARRAAPRRRGSRAHGPSATIRPPDRITARSHSRAANGRSWVTTSIVRSIGVEHLEQLAPRARVEVRRRLVEHEQPRVHREHGRDRHAPPLAERELVRRAVRHVLHPHGRQRVRHARAAPRSRARPRLSGPKATSSPTVGMNSWSSGSWNTSPTRGAQLAHVVADARPATSSSPSPRQQAVEVQHQRRLAGAVGAEHRDALAVGDVAGRRRRGPATPFG